MKLPNFLKETIEQYPPFTTKEEEFEFYGGLNKRNKNDKMNEVALRHLKFGIDRARYYSLVYKADIEEMFDLAIMGILEAAKTFDPKRNVRFCTYANENILNRIRRPELGGDGIWRENEDWKIRKMEIENFGYDMVGDIAVVYPKFGNDDKIHRINSILEQIDTKPKYIEIFRKKFGINENCSFNLPLTYQQVGEIYGLTKQRVEQVCNFIISKVKKKINA